MDTETLPRGFRQSTESGLILPEEISRERQVYSKADWMTLDRATKLLRQMGITLFLKCDTPACASAPIERLRRLDGGITFRCAHADREFRKL